MRALLLKVDAQLIPFSYLKRTDSKAHYSIGWNGSKGRTVIRYFSIGLSVRSNYFNN